MRGSAGKIFATTLLYYVISFYEFLQHDHNLIKLNFDLLTSSLGCGDSGVCGQNICFHVSALVIPFNLICIMIIYFKLYFDLLTPTPRSGGGGGGLQAKYLVPCCCIRDSLFFDMLHDHVLKKLKLTFWPQPQGQLSGYIS